MQLTVLLCPLFHRQSAHFDLFRRGQRSSWGHEADCGRTEETIGSAQSRRTQPARPGQSSTHRCCTRWPLNTHRQAQANSITICAIQDNGPICGSLKYNFLLFLINLCNNFLIVNIYTLEHVTAGMIKRFFFFFYLEGVSSISTWSHSEAERVKSCDLPPQQSL